MTGPLEHAVSTSTSPTAGDWLQYLTVRAVVGVLQVLPWSCARALAWPMGRLGWLLDRRKRRRRTIANLQRAFPDMDRRRARRVLKGVYRHLSEVLIDGVVFAGRAARGRVRDLLEVEGFDQLTPADRERGVIFVTGHFGHWELLGLAAPVVGFPVWSAARGFSNPLVNDYVRRLRQNTGQQVVDKDRAPLRLMRLLRRGESVALLIDQDARRYGIFVDYFGRPASTSPMAGRLAVRTGSPVAFVYGMRVPGSNRFRLVCRNVVRPDPEADEADECRRITRSLTADLEALVRRNPDKWLWLHRRWKTYPGKYENQLAPAAAGAESPVGAGERNAEGEVH